MTTRNSYLGSFWQQKCCEESKDKMTLKGWEKRPRRKLTVGTEGQHKWGNNLRIRGDDRAYYVWCLRLCLDMNFWRVFLNLSVLNIVSPDRVGCDRMPFQPFEFHGTASKILSLKADIPLKTKSQIQNTETIVKFPFCSRKNSSRLW